LPRLEDPGFGAAGPRRRDGHGGGRDRARARRAVAHRGRRRPERRDARRRPRARTPRRARPANLARARAGRDAALRGRRVRLAHLHLSPALRRRPAGDARRARTRRAAGPARLAGLARGRAVSRPEHPRLLRPRPSTGAARVVARRRPSGRGRASPEPRRRCRRLGDTRMSDATTRPAFYALHGGGWRDYVTLLHPPYTLWHL